MLRYNHFEWDEKPRFGTESVEFARCQHCDRIIWLEEHRFRTEMEWFAFYCTVCGKQSSFHDGPSMRDQMGSTTSVLRLVFCG